MKNFSLTDRENCAIILKRIRCYLDATFICYVYMLRLYATVAQSVEQLIRNQQVAGSSPASSSSVGDPSARLKKSSRSEGGTS